MVQEDFRLCRLALVKDLFSNSVKAHCQDISSVPAASGR